MTRVAAAYALALRCNLGGGGDAAAAAAVLGGGLRGGRECVRRAAAYGLAQAGQAAVPVLLAALAAGLPSQAKVLALHALGQAAAEPGVAVADALAAAAAVALAELAAYAGPGAAGGDAGDDAGANRTTVYSGEVAVDHYANERRRALATVAQAAGVLGQRTARAGAAGLTVRLFRLAAGFAAAAEPGARFPSYMKSVMVREQGSCRGSLPHPPLAAMGEVGAW